MSLLDQASLIVTPNAYKANKLYSVIPNTTLGDMTVSRALSATRVNSAKFIEIARTNLVLYSEQFDLTPTPWGRADTTVTANATTAPDGTSTADNVVPFATAAFHNIRQFISVTPSISHTFSVYAKANGYTKVSIADAATGGFAARFDLSAVSVISTITGTTATIVPMGIGWYRLTATFTTTAASTPSITGYPTGATLNSYGASFTGDGTSGVFLWGAQLEIGSVATEYIPTTTVARTKFAGITQDGLYGANIPRIDYPPLGGCPSILVEPARTNLVLYSEEFDNASWSKTNVVVTANSTASPNGTLTADLISYNSSTNNNLTFTTTNAITSSYTISVFAKKGTGSVLRIREVWFLGTASTFDLNNGIVLSGTGKIESYPNGWYRCSITQAYTNTQTPIGWSFDSNLNIYNLYLWGAQCEAGAYATSYIPTTTAAVLRNADAIKNINATTLIGQTEGTMFVEIDIKAFDVGAFFTISDGTIANYIQMYTYNDNKIYCDRVASNIPLGFSTPSALTAGTYKIAFGYQSGSSALFINGAQVGATSGATFTFGSMGKVNIGSGYSDSTFFNNRIKSAALFKTRLTPDQCILLTGASFSTYPEMASALIYTIQ
jgi:hypothetical protein